MSLDEDIIGLDAANSNPSLLQFSYVYGPFPAVSYKNFMIPIRPRQIPENDNSRIYGFIQKKLYDIGANTSEIWREVCEDFACGIKQFRKSKDYKQR